MPDDRAIEPEQQQRFCAEACVLESKTVAAAATITATSHRNLEITKDSCSERIERTDSAGFRVDMDEKGRSKPYAAKPDKVKTIVFFEDLRSF
jgi:hypothetical protein